MKKQNGQLSMFDAPAPAVEERVHAKVKPGYKQTEVGVIPEDWEVICLGSITLKVGSGITPTGGEKVYKKEGRCFIRSQNVGWGKLLLNDVAFIAEDAHAKFKATEIKIDDVLLNITGASIGRSAVADKRIVGGNVNQHVCIIRTSPEQLEPHFANWFLISSLGQKQIDSFQAGGNREGLNFGQIKSFKIPLPPIQEQQLISANLNNVDDLIASLDNLIAKKRDIKQGAMQELLAGKRRLAGFGREWSAKRIGDVVERIVGGGTPARSRPEYWNGTIPWVTVKDFATFNPYSTQEYITEAGLKSSASNLIKKGTIITSTRMAIGHAVVYDVDVSINQDLKAIYLKKDTSTMFMLHWLEQHRGVIESLGGGSTVKGISLPDLRNIPFLQPPLPEQRAIASILSDMDAEIAALERKREKTRALKQGMMQELLTGRIRLV